ncbi:MAG: hydantoinase B/oxoprolinase family protein [Deltaproteobacteria bacterium]|nr:hydantoinase B/oxoprolinase family protein [Deltaproteobacteria bacterium]
MEAKPLITSVDPITFEILSHRLYQIAKEMGTALERVGGTVNTTQMHDYMASLYLANGDVLSAGDSMGWHVACAGFAVKRIIERFSDKIYPDDIFLLNDPYLAAIHQSDVYLISPIHFHGRLIGWSATFVHVMDIGALSPGGNSPDATEICHEGIRIPGIKLVERGELRKDLFDAFINMTRQPVMVGLDLKCEIAANNVAKSRMQTLYEQFGPELVTAVSQEMLNYSEAVVRRRIAEIPDGSWSDSGSINAGETWNVHVKLTKKGDGLLFDFTGSSAQAKKGINLPYHATFGACYESMLCTLAYDLPKNHGALRPIEVIAPTGTVVNPTPPAPVSLNTTSGGATVKFVANSAMMQMLATSDKWSGEVMALNAGHRLARHAGVNQHGKYYVSTLSEGALDGTGARSYKDGDDTGRGLSCHNIEWLEANFPLLYLFRRNTMGGAGAGKFRGGTGGESALTVHDAPQGKVKGVALGVAGVRNSGQGMFGGYPGAPSLLMLTEGARVEETITAQQAPDRLEELRGTSKLLPYCEFDIAKNSILYMRMSSGGGYGDPLDREPERVLRDVENGLVSRQEAREVYGVVIDGMEPVLNLASTEGTRSEFKKKRLQEQP